ncbi:MAG: hypothetical protein ACOZNI_05195 [Myxococcota bacterium]
MDDLNWCLLGGFLVDAAHDVAEEDSEFFGDGLPAIVGCGRLRCAECGESVRQVPGRVPVEGSEASEVYALPDWRTSAKFEDEDPPVVLRFYACACHLWVERDVRPLRDPDRDPDQPVFPWQCVGHPRTALPLVLDGETVDATTDFGALCRRMLTGGAPASARAPERELPTGWVRKLYVRLTGTEAADAMAAAMRDFLGDADPRVRGGALLFFRTFPTAAGPALVDACETLADPSWDAPDPVHGGRPLRDRAIAALAAYLLTTRDAKAARVALGALAGTGNLRPLLLAWLERDPEALLVAVTRGAVSASPEDVLSAVAEAAPEHVAEAAGLAVGRGASVSDAIAWAANVSPTASDEARAGARAWHDHGYAIPRGNARALAKSARSPAAVAVLLRAWHRGGDPARALAAHLASMVVDADPDVCGLALAFFAEAPDAPDRGALKAAFALPGLASRKNPFAPGDLRSSAARALAARLPSLSIPDRDAVRAEALVPYRAGSVIRGLCEHDLRWVLDNLDALLSGTPAVLPDVLKAAYSANRSLTPLVVTALARVPPRFVREAVMALPPGPLRDEALTLIPSR